MAVPISRTPTSITPAPSTIPTLTLHVHPSYYKDGLLNPAPPTQKVSSVKLTLGKTDADILLIFPISGGSTELVTLGHSILRAILPHLCG